PDHHGRYVFREASGAPVSAFQQKENLVTRWRWLSHTALETGPAGDPNPARLLRLSRRGPSLAGPWPLFLLLQQSGKLRPYLPPVLFRPLRPNPVNGPPEMKHRLADVSLARINLAQTAVGGPACRRVAKHLVQVNRSFIDRKSVV